MMSPDRETPRAEVEEGQMPTTLIKLTDRDGCTRRGERNALKWGDGVTHAADLARPPRLCTAGVIHAYPSLLSAVMFNPIHANIRDPLAFRSEGVVVATDRGLKVGVRTLTTIKRVTLPVVTTAQRVRFGILCAWEVCDDPEWRRWAAAWLDGSDRSSRAAAEAARAVTWAAAEAAEAAAWAVEAKAEAAAWAAAWAAAAAEAAAGCVLDLDALAARAIAEEMQHAG